MRGEELEAAVATPPAGAGGSQLDLPRQQAGGEERGADAISFGIEPESFGIEPEGSLRREGEREVAHCDADVQRFGSVAHLAMRHCDLGPNDALELLGADVRPDVRNEMFQGEPGLQQARLRESQWQAAGGETQVTVHGDSSSGSISAVQNPQLRQRKKQVSWAQDESLQTVRFLPPTPRALILRALEMAGLVDDSKERCSNGGLSVRVFFQASLLRLQAWADAESDALRPEYANRYGKPVPYRQEYAQAWSVLAGLYKGDATKLFAAVIDGDRGVKLLSVTAITLPCVHAALENIQEAGARGVLADALASLRDDTRLAATGTELCSSGPANFDKHAQVPTEAAEAAEAVVEAEEEVDDDDPLATMCSALDALHSERKQQQPQGKEIAVAARDLVVSRLEERQLARDRLMAELGLSDDSDSD
jgi:hypothetical protein